MGKVSSKKGNQRKKAGKGSGRSRSGAKGEGPAKFTCVHCGRRLGPNARALFVEEEVGRIFCSEDCISALFAPEIERLEHEFYGFLETGDLSVSERERHAHLRWSTLKDPQEVWRDRTGEGDLRHQLISEFDASGEKIWCVCICLFLRGEPSFLYLAFTTRNEGVVANYRRGESLAVASEGSREAKQEARGRSDCLASPFTEEELRAASLAMERRKDDIPPEEFEKYQALIDKTLDQPDEVWSFTQEGPGEQGDDASKMFHFLRRYPSSALPGHWYVVVARETDKEDQIEIVDAFPTRDESLVDRFRRGELEAGDASQAPASRLVH